MKMFNQTAWFIDQQYIWKKCIDIFYFLHGGINKGKVASETTAFGCVCPGMPRQSLASLDLQLIRLACGLYHIKNNSKWNISWFRWKQRCFSHILIHTVSNYLIKCAFFQSEDSLIINISGRKQSMS